MYILLVFIIISCHYSTIAAKKTPIDLDIHTKDTTDQVEVTKKEDRSMVIYKIEPKSKYKIGRFTDGNKVIYEPEENVTFKHLEVKSNKATNYEPIIVSLKYSQGMCNKAEVTYFLVDNEWKRVSEGIVGYLTKLLKEGQKIVREVEFGAYVAYTKERNKKYREIDVNKKDLISGITRKDFKEDNIEAWLYKADEDSVIFQVTSGNSQIWKWDNYVCGCYEVKVYPKLDPVLIVLTVKYMKETNILYYKKAGQHKYSEIKKEQFDEELLKTIQSLKFVSEANKEGENESNKDES